MSSSLTETQSVEEEEQPSGYLPFFISGLIGASIPLVILLAAKLV